MKDEEFVHGDLTRKLINIAYKVNDSLGYGYPEKIYQKAFEKQLIREKTSYKRESYSKILYDGEIVGRYYLDFLIDNIVAVELKVRREVYESDWIQLLNYLKAKNLNVGLLIVFTKLGIKIKRVMN